MAFMITKNDIDRVYGTPYTPAPKITKSDLDKVYGTQPTATQTRNYTDIQRSSLPNLIKQQTSGLNTLAIQTAKEKYGNSLYVPASPFSVENEKRNKLNYIVNENMRHTSGWGMNNPYSQLDYINESERTAISDLVAQKNYDSAYDYYEKISKDLNKRQAESEYRQVKGFSEKYPVTSLVTNALSTPFKTFEYGVNLAEYADNKLEDRSTYLDKNSPTFSTSRYSEAVMDSLMKDTGIIGQIVRSAFASASNQYAVSKIVGAGPLTELFMAGRTAQDSLYQNAKLGVDGDKSVVNSLGKAAISYGTERYFPSEKLMGVKADDTINALWKSYKTAALSEGIEEVADNIITNIWDSIQLGDQSEISQLIRNYQQQGYSKYSAVVKAGVEKYVVDSLIGFLTGATAGGMTTYGVNKIDTIKQSLAESDRFGIVHKVYEQELNKQSKDSIAEINDIELFQDTGKNYIERNHNKNKTVKYEKTLVEDVVYEIEYGKLSSEYKKLYDAGKSGDVKRAVSFVEKVVTQKSIEKLKRHGTDTYILPITKLSVAAKNKNGLAFAKYISENTGQPVFHGIYQSPETSTKNNSTWSRMKKPYSKFDIFDGLDYTDIIGKKFILVDDNVTTGRSFIGLKQFIEENGGQVVDYYAPTKGTDWSEKLIVTDETWRNITELNEQYVLKGKPSIYEFARINKLKREISQKGLTEREAEEFYRRYRMVGRDD